MAGFAFLQDTGNTTGTGGITFTPAATTAKSLLVAKIVAPTTTASTPPTSDWWLARRTVQAAVGLVETWYYRPSGSTTNNPGGATSFAFTGAGGVAYRGSLAEFMPPGGTDVILHSVGKAGAASGSTFTLATAQGNAAAVLGVATVGVFFNANVAAGPSWGGTFTGWTRATALTNGPPFVWSSYYALNLAAAGTQSLAPTFSFSTGETGWAGHVLTFRARVFRNLRLDGAEVSNLLALSPDGQALLMLGDVEGVGRSVSPNLGDQWEQTRSGLWQDHWGQFATAAWSPFGAGGGDPATGVVYAAVGKNNDGGFAVSTDGGCTWAMRSTAVQCVGNNARPPLPTSFHVRSTGNLLAFDTTSSIIYLATYNGGIARSTDRGATWTYIGLAGGSFYPRTLVINPSNFNELWVGCYDWDGTGAFGKVWHCTTASTATATTGVGPFTQDTGAPPSVEELRVVGSHLYAACNVQGIWRAALTGGAWAQLANANIDTTGGSLWTSVDGYVDGTAKDVLIAACDSGVKQGANAHVTNVVQVNDAAGTPTYTDLTGTATITINTIPPDGRVMWKQNFYGALGNAGFAIPHVLIDPTDATRQTVYVSGYGGMFRTYDGGAHWDMPVNGMNMSKFNHGAIDPRNPSHVVYAGSDTEHSDLLDPTGGDPSKWFGPPFPQKKCESHAVAFDPVDSRVYGGTNTKYGENAGGGVFYRAPASSVWTDTGYTTSGPAGGNAVMGLFAGRDASGSRFLCAAAQGAGMWRWTGGTTWAQVDTTVGTSGQTAQVCPFAQDSSPAVIYCYDRGQGVFRSTDYGAHWTLIWAKAAADIRSGWLAVNPAVPGELWVSADDGLCKLSGARTGTVANGAITRTTITGFANGAGGIAFGPDGNLYAVRLASAGTPSNQLQVSTNGGATWQDVCGGDGSFASCAALPAQLLITSAGIILVTTDTNQAVYGYISTTSASVPAITTTTLPPGTTSVAYPSTTLAVSGGVSPYTWSLASGALPTGLSLSAAGVITGTPTGTGTSPFTVQVSDGNSLTDTQALSITVTAAVTVTTTSPLPGGTAGSAYTDTLTASGGAGAPYTWSVTAGSMAPGLSLSASGVLSGTLAAVGTFTFTATATDGAGRAGSASLSITVAAGVLTITTAALAPATAGIPYTAALTSTGGTPPDTWTVTAGALPPGITLASTGILSGTPTATGTSSFTIQVADSAAHTATASLSITVYQLAVGPPPVAKWKILYGPAQPTGGVTGEIIQAQAKTITLRTEPDQNHEVSFDADGLSPAVAAITELETDLIVLYGTEVIFCGRVVPTQDTLTAAGHRVQVTALDYREVLRRRAVLPGDTLSWASTEQATIAWNMIQATQGRPGGNLGIARGTGQSTGITRTYTATLGDYIGDNITTLAQLASGFDWQITPYGLSDLRLDVFSPQQGTDRGVVLAWGGARISSITRNVDPSTFADAVYVTSSASTAGTKTLTPVHLEDPDIGTRPEQRWDTVIGTDDQTQSTLNDHAAALLNQAQVVIPSYTVVFYPGAWGGPSDIWLGDTITLQIGSGRLQVNDQLRIVEMSFQISSDNVETLTLTVGQIPFRLNKKIASILKRLRYLDTR